MDRLNGIVHLASTSANRTKDDLENEVDIRRIDPECFRIPTEHLANSPDSRNFFERFCSWTPGRNTASHYAHPLNLSGMWGLGQIKNPQKVSERLNAGRNGNDQVLLPTGSVMWVECITTWYKLNFSLPGLQCEGFPGQELIVSHFQVDKEDGCLEVVYCLRHANNASECRFSPSYSKGFQYRLRIRQKVPNDRIVPTPLPAYACRLKQCFLLDSKMSELGVDRDPGDYPIDETVIDGDQSSGARSSASTSLLPSPSQIGCHDSEVADEMAGDSRSRQSPLLPVPSSDVEEQEVRIKGELDVRTPSPELHSAQTRCRGSLSVALSARDLEDDCVLVRLVQSGDPEDEDDSSPEGKRSPKKRKSLRDDDPYRPGESDSDEEATDDEDGNIEGPSVGSGKPKRRRKTTSKAGQTQVATPNPGPLQDPGSEQSGRGLPISKSFFVSSCRACQLTSRSTPSDRQVDTLRIRQEVSDGSNFPVRWLTMQLVPDFISPDRPLTYLQLIWATE
jgi:hypothetical protein